MARRKGGDPLEVLTLDLDGEMFAIEVAHVREILDLVPVTEVPHAASFVSGLINVRGKVVPLADLKLKLGMERRAATADSRIVVVELDLDGEPVMVGIRADKVHEVATVAAAALQEAPRLGTRWRPEYISCIGRHGEAFMVVLDVESILLAALARSSDAAPQPA